MWLSLDDASLVPTYRKGPFFWGSALPALVRLLEGLQRQEFADKVFAVTSLGHLRLTTAPDFVQEEKHDVVTVGPSRSGEGYVVDYVEANTGRSAAGRWCREEELPDVVECYLLRLLLHS